MYLSLFFFFFNFRVEGAEEAGWVLTDGQQRVSPLPRERQLSSPPFTLTVTTSSNTNTSDTSEQPTPPTETARQKPPPERERKKKVPFD